VNFYAPGGEDRFVFETFFRGQRGGTFVDIAPGAVDGTCPSLFFERYLGWRGLRAAASGLRDARLSSVLAAEGLERIDYCAIGSGDVGLIEDLDPGRFRISVCSIDAGADEGRLARAMAARELARVAVIGGRQVYRHASVRVLPRTSVICSVWHGDPDRYELLRTHAACLAAQTVPVEPIYVFDGDDEPPEWLAGRKVIVRENTTIYQAWNVALALVSTPLVMNLNLDDRLFPQAVALLETMLAREDAALIGGDWQVCYSQAETDAVGPCSEAAQLPFVPEWPPAPGTRTRLGSGTGARGTYGPAVMWRVDTHIGAPRYSWRLPDGTALKVAGDAAFWTIVTKHLGKKAIRVPWIIGNYHSHPSTQAEFRHPQDELSLMGLLGISLL
jgi:hypothetical protein